jgi:hypothetical protein
MRPMRLEYVLGFRMSFLHTMMRMRRVITLVGGIGCAASASPGASTPFLRGATYGEPDRGNLAGRPAAGLLFRPSSIWTSLFAAAGSCFFTGVTEPLTPERRDIMLASVPMVLCCGNHCLFWNCSIPFGVAPPTGAAGGRAAAKSVDAAWLLTALRRLASDTGDALELQANTCSSLLELEPPSSFFLVSPTAKCNLKFDADETKMQSPRAVQTRYWTYRGVGIMPR